LGSTESFLGGLRVIVQIDAECPRVDSQSNADTSQKVMIYSFVFVWNNDNTSKYIFTQHALEISYRVRVSDSVDDLEFFLKLAAKLPLKPVLQFCKGWGWSEGVGQEATLL
jgi:hypothetical protein